MKSSARLTIAFSLLAALLLGACASPYRQASAMRSGYTSKDIDQKTVMVEYTLYKSDQDLADDLALYRAAEIAKSRGFAGFQVVSESRFHPVLLLGYTSRRAITVKLLTQEEIEQNIGSKQRVYGAQWVLDHRGYLVQTPPPAAKK